MAALPVLTVACRGAFAVSRQLRVRSLRVATLVVGGPSLLRIPAQAYQAIILAPGSAWVTKCQQVPGHIARNWLCWDSLLSVLPPL